MSQPENIARLGPFAALIFDQDGTLLEVEALHCNCWCQLASAQGAVFTAQTFADFAGQGDPAIAAFLAPQTGLSAEQLVEKKRALYRQHLDLIPLMPGARELLQQAHEAGFTIALATISPEQETLHVMKALSLTPFFSAMVHRESDLPHRSGQRVRSKPAPDIYLAAAALLQVDPAQCCAFEDSWTGMTAARRAGMSVVVIPTPYSCGADFSGANAVATSLSRIQVDDQRWITVTLGNPQAERTVSPAPRPGSGSTSAARGLNQNTEVPHLPYKAVILAGGLGTRLRSLSPHQPKALATINGQPFIELQLRQLREAGLRRVLLCVGHQRRLIMDLLGQGERWGLQIEYAIEEQPLGTAGALKNARAQLQEESCFLLLNGDTFTEVDFAALVVWHDQHGGLGTLCVRRVEDAAGKGVVELDEEGRLTGFHEKRSSGEPALINAGVYLFSTELLDHIPPDQPVSLEQTVLPSLLREGSRLYGYSTTGTFIDIGTPGDYLRAQQELRKYG